MMYEFSINKCTTKKYSVTCNIRWTISFVLGTQSVLQLGFFYNYKLGPIGPPLDF